MWFSIFFLLQQTPSKMGILLTLLHSELQKLHGVLAVLSAIGLKESRCSKGSRFFVVLS